MRTSSQVLFGYSLVDLLESVYHFGCRFWFIVTVLWVELDQERYTGPVDQVKSVYLKVLRNL